MNVRSRHAVLRFGGVIFSTFGLAQCTPPGYAADVISGDQQQVSVKAGNYANPGPIASEHCAKFGRAAVLQDANGGIYRFICQQPPR
jgi:hypothetical protein